MTMLTLDQATREYNQLRRASDDHGIMGAYRELQDRHGRDSIPPHTAIMDRRAARAPGYRDSLEHVLTDEQDQDYAGLTPTQRKTYDDERWHWGLDHNEAMAAAR